jgi:hypothetical protein
MQQLAEIIGIHHVTQHRETEANGSSLNSLIKIAKANLPAAQLKTEQLKAAQLKAISGGPKAPTRYRPYGNINASTSQPKPLPGMSFVFLQRSF